MDETPPTSDRKKSLADYQKALKRAEKERLRVQKEREQELERQKKLEEKERLRLQKEREQELERQKRLEEKEQRLREKQAKKEEEERLKEEKRLKRIEEQRKREEEKEAERKKKEEEKRKKEEERLQREQEKKKEEDFKIKLEEKQRAVLLGFLVKNESKKDTLTSTLTTSGLFMQFELRKDMRMAPIHRMSESILESKRRNLDELFQTEVSDTAQASQASIIGLPRFGRTNYLKELRAKQRTPLSYPSTWPTEPPEVQLLEDGPCSTLNSSALKYHGSRGHGGTVWLRAKLFQFVENYRPAYYGTWRRRSRTVTGRRPFAQDSSQLDYSVDSDDEWEEEEPGESITQSENEEEEEKDEDDEDEDDDDQFFVPHGYLSDDEGVAADEVGGEDDEHAEELKSLRRRLSVVEYEMAHSRGLQRLKPVVIGPVWFSDPLEWGKAVSSVNDTVNELSENKENVENFPSSEKTGAQSILSSLVIHRVHLWDNTIPIPVRMEPAPTPGMRRPKKELPEEALPYLIYLVHKNTLGKPKLAFEFRVFWHQHTTGSLPKCTRYADFKRQNAAAAKALAQRSGSSVPGPLVGDELALSQNLVLSKLFDIAVFEEGRWSVQPDVIRRWKTQLAEICGVADLLKLDDNADDVEFSNFSFPDWKYLTDVTLLGKKSNRPSIRNRRSLDQSLASEAAPTTDASTDSPKVAPSPRIADSPQVIVQLTSQPGEPVQKAHSQVQDKNPNGHAIIKRDPPSNHLVSDSSKQVLSLTSSARKRVTLDKFFTPPVKRVHVDKDEPIVVDSD